MIGRRRADPHVPRELRLVQNISASEGAHRQEALEIAQLPNVQELSDIALEVGLAVGGKPLVARGCGALKRGGRESARQDAALDLLAGLGLASVIGLGIAAVYRFTHRGLNYERSFLTTLQLMAPIVALVMMFIAFVKGLVYEYAEAAKNDLFRLVETRHMVGEIAYIQVTGPVAYVTRAIEALRGVRRVLEDGGILMLSTGDFSSLAALLSGTRWHLLTAPGQPGTEIPRETGQDG